jgi:uncharacterized membrane protein
MDPQVVGEALFRWVHVVAGVLWIGLLYFFNWVNGPFAKTLDADTKPKVVPELLPRALYFFRWGAAYTWVSGFLLLGLVYYMNGQALMSDELGQGKSAMFAGLAAVFLGAILYDVLWKFMAGKPEVALGISFVLLVALMWALTAKAGVGGRAMFIHVGALFGTAMAMNVWMRIWPAQRKIISAIKNGDAPDGAWAAMAGLRSKHNTYLSVPLIFIMVSNHYPTLLGSENNWGILACIIALGWVVTFLLYKKSGSDATKQF